jgi:hypothetical protein
VQPIGNRDRVPHPNWVAYGTDAFLEWLLDVHRDETVVMRVYAQFLFTVDKLELLGPRVDDPRKIKKLEGYDGLGEARYNDNSGAYREFFKFGRLGGQKVVVFADGDRKTSNDFRRSRYDRADRTLDAAFTEHGITHARDW